MAFEEGYFDVPRGISLSELAEKLGVSHQAVSERLRWSYLYLVQDTLFLGGRSPPLGVEPRPGPVPRTTIADIDTVSNLVSGE